MTNGTLDVWLQQARGYSRQRDFPAAINIYRQILANNPDAVPAYEGMALVAFQSGDYPLAVDAFVRLTQLEPQEARHYVNLGAVHNRTRNYPLAIDALRKAIQKDRRQAEAYYNLGIAHRKQKQFSLAVSAYKEAIRLNPQMAEAFQNLGNLYSEMSNHALAIVNFRKALEIDPQFEKARQGLDKAESAARQAKADHNPFGRLVPADAAAIRSAVSECRELSFNERLIDRQRVRRIADELADLVAESENYLRQRLGPATLELERAVAEGRTNKQNYGRASQRFSETLESWRQLHGQLSKKFRDLREHEALVEQPGGLTDTAHGG